MKKSTIIMEGDLEKKKTYGTTEEWLVDDKSLSDVLCDMELKKVKITIEVEE